MKKKLKKTKIVGKIYLTTTIPIDTRMNKKKILVSQDIDQKPIGKTTNQLANKPLNSPTTNINTNSNHTTSKFVGGRISHSNLISNNNNNTRSKHKKSQNQAIIMEAMGARYRKMVYHPYNNNTK